MSVNFLMSDWTGGNNDSNCNSLVLEKAERQCPAIVFTSRTTPYS